MLTKRNKFYVESDEDEYTVLICGENITNVIQLYMDNMSAYGVYNERNMDQDMCHWHWTVTDIHFVRQFLISKGLTETNNINDCR